MVNKSMRLVAKAAESAAARLRAVAAEEPTTSQVMLSRQTVITQAACGNSSDASALQPAEVAVLGSRGDVLLYIEDCKLKFVYSGESDNVPNRRRLRKPRVSQKWLKPKLTQVGFTKICENGVTPSVVRRVGL